MNHLPLIRKSLSKKDLLRKAELIITSKPSHSKSAELNIRLIEKNAKRRKLHQAELQVFSNSRGCPSSQLNNLFAKKATQAKRLHSAQIFSMTK